MVKIKGTYQSRNRFASYEANQLDEGWEVIVLSFGNRIAEQTHALSPLPILERMITTALDMASKGEAPRYDFNQRKPRQVHDPAKRRKRASPHGLVTTEDKGELLNAQQPKQ